MRRIVVMLGAVVALAACSGSGSEIVISEQNAMNWAYEKSAELATRIVEAKDYETFSAARTEFEAFEEAFREQIGGDEYLIFLEESALILNN